ncbi:hypothetical protein VB716_16265 [Synechococcus sp. CCY9201]|jgi:hypothetical protein|uniref:hypothetical protein n=1 Tax=unclassified Synechococcus TaxID=2626047 RepID=UPI0018CC8AAF|nr:MULTISPECIES: hypothetical protein [unclassified Synechococcus]MEA5423455.1 hypothetical protein [Synechococcus sp. CCY9202]MEA5475772.1 hypothetical protein [Synechococcus sp. CCY9201]QPN67539.1 hypothetical protein H8F26_04975 [Synechococcus sp. CBW1006]CAK6687108.1 hypothetical protein IFHNHDMJ_00133 [Synechococcus sp. CBW1107]
MAEIAPRLEELEGLHQGRSFMRTTGGGVTLLGLGPWGDGIARLLLEPSDLLLIVGLVLLAAQAGHRPAAARLALAAEWRERFQRVTPWG